MATLQDLPSELIFHIAQYCRRADMNRFIRFDKRLREIIRPELYKRNIRDEYGDAMYWAACKGNSDTFERLHSAGAEWNDQSASFSNEKVRRVFSPGLPGQHPRDVYFSPLHIAAGMGQDQAVRWLL